MRVETQSIGEGYRLASAVLIYTNTGAGHAFATKHYVEEVQGRPTIRPGQPFTDVDYMALVQALAPARRPGVRWHDHRVLADGLGRTIWWAPPQRRSLFFKQSKQASGTFDGKGVCPTPGLVFMAVDADLFVYAFKGASIPTPDTKLYQAPFFNVWSRGQVCRGSAVAPKRDGSADLDSWERMFFGSYFTHPNFTEKDRLIVGADPVAFWERQITKPDGAFPEDVLYDLDLTVNDLLQPALSKRLERIPVAKGEF